MKKLLLVTTAIAGVAMMSAPASAAVKMDLGGFFRGYGVFADNNDPAGTSTYGFEFRRDTELHATGETTLDNGLTVGAHTELKLAQGGNGISTDEIYGYASGGYGRVNLGVEDGAAYLLQVAAPSADSNVDGLRTNISSITSNSSNATFANVQTLTGANGNLDYAQSDFGGPANGTDRLTYMTPKFNGFQAGASYAPNNTIANNIAAPATDNDVVFSGTGAEAQFKNLWEASARYDGEFEGFAFGAGAGYSDSSIEKDPTAADLTTAAAGVYALNDGIKSWNGGLSIAAQGFSLGGAYKHSETSRSAQTIVASDLAANVASGDITTKTWVVGGAYDNGPWHAGASYLNTKTELDAVAIGANANNIASSELDADKYTIGGGYTFGPGMTFRGAVAWGSFDDKSTGAAAADDNDFTQVTVGTDIQF